MTQAHASLWYGIAPKGHTLGRKGFPIIVENYLDSLGEGDNLWGIAHDIVSAHGVELVYHGYQDDDERVGLAPLGALVTVNDLLVVQPLVVQPEWDMKVVSAAQALKWPGPFVLNWYLSVRVNW